MSVCRIGLCAQLCGNSCYNPYDKSVNDCERFCFLYCFQYCVTLTTNRHVRKTFTPREEAIDFGKDYEYLMAAYYGLVLSLNDDVVDYKMSTNNKDMGDFDDVVIEVELKNGEQHVFAVQLKHVARIIALIKLTTDNKQFSLKKYSNEFRKVKASYEKLRSYGAPFENCHFILYSNSILEKFEEIDENGKRLETIVAGKKTESNITIQKYDNCVGKNLLNLCDVDNNFIYRFKTCEEGSTDEEFFKQFSFYTKQKDAKEVQSLIGGIIFTTFKNCSPNVVINYLSYFNYWCRRDYGAFKLTKDDVKLKLAELLLTPHIVEPKLDQLEIVNDEKFRLLIIEIINDFDIILIENKSDTIMNRIWTLLLMGCPTTTTEWSRPISNVYINAYQEKFEIPISAQSENFNELSLKKIYVILWHKGVLPLIVETKKHSTDQNVSLALELCKNVKNKKKFIVIGKNVIKNVSDWRIMKNLADLTNFNTTVSQRLSLSLQGRPRISLKQFVIVDDRLSKIFSSNELIEMLDDKFVIGDNCMEKIPKYYVTRLTPKILLSSKIIDEIKSDLFVVSCQDNTVNIYKCFKTNTVELNKYLLLQQSRSMEEYIPKQYSIFNLSKMQKNSRDISDKFVILVNSNCTKQQFEEICLMNKSKNCHHVRFIDDERIEWIETRGSIYELQKYQLDFKDFKEDDFVKDVEVFDYFNNNINLICADPGMGKSIMMTILKFKCPSSHWVIKVNLIEHVKYFKKNHDVNEALEYFLNIGNKNRFVGEVVKILSSHKKILFLWDGFDEVPKSCVNSVISTIETLASEGFLQWISARSNSKDFLETTFNLFSLTLRQFSKQDQYDYIYNHLKDSYDDEDRVQQIVNKVNENISTSLSSGYFDYSGIPLQIHMLVEVFLKSPQKQMDKLQIVTLVDIYQEFIQGKFDCMFAKADADVDNYHMQQIQQQFKEARLPQYEIAALKASFDEDTFLTVKLDCDELLDELLEGEDILGMIIGINDEKRPVFAHKTYQEFLTALWLVENNQSHPNLISMLFQEEYSNIRLMFDMLLAKDCPVHFAVLYKNLNLLEKHKSDIATCKDSGGRNALHVACAWGRRHPPIKTMDNNEKIITTSRSEDDNREKYLESIQFLFCHNTHLSGLEEILTNPVAFEEAKKIFNKLSNQEGEGINRESTVLGNEANKILIPSETVIKVVEEDKDYLEILKFLLNHKCNPLDNDKLLKWNAFQYADQTLSLTAIDLMLKHYPIEIHSLRNFNHVPTLLHYSSAFNYNNLLETINDIPYIEYKYEHGNVSLLQLSAEANNFHCLSKLLTTKHYQDAVNLPSAFSGNPLVSAAFHGNLQMIDILIKNGAKINGHKISPLVGAVLGCSKTCCDALLEAGANVNEPIADGHTALLLATAINHKEIIKLLLDHGADVSYVNNDLTALDYAVGRGSLEVTQLLLEHKPNINRQNKNLGYTVLHRASELNNLYILKCLLENGANTKIKSNKLLTALHVALMSRQEKSAMELIKADPSVINEYGWSDDGSQLTPMILAALENYAEVIEILVKYGADVHSSEAYTTPLHIAAEKGFDACVIALIKSGASVNRISSQDFAPLFCSVDNLSTLKILLDNSADVNSTNKFGRTTLHHATFRGKIDSVAELIRRGANIDVQDKEKKTPFFYSIYRKHLDIMKFLLDQGASVGRDGIELLCQAAKSDLPDCITLLLDRGVEINALDNQGQTALFYASMHTNGCVKVLLNKGANPNIRSRMDLISELSPLVFPLLFSRIDIIEELVKAGADMKAALGSMSALHVAAILGDIFSVIYLAGAGADVNSVDDKGRSPLHYLSQGNMNDAILQTLMKVKGFDFHAHINYNNEDCAKELIAKGANVNQVDANSLTPLHLAYHQNLSKLIKLLINHGADVNAVNDKKQSPLHFCYLVGAMDNADLLLKCGASLDIIDEFGKSSLFYAVESVHKQGLQDLDVLKKLHKLGANIESADEEGLTFLHKACNDGMIETVDFLLYNGVNVESGKINIQNNEGNTPLHFAALGGHQEIISRLYKAGCEVNIQNNEGFTPLHLASQHGFYDCSKILVEAGAKINEVNKAGYMALHLAIDSGKADLISFLIQNGTMIDSKSLHLAVASDNLEILKLIYENKEECDSVEDNLIHVVINNNSDNVNILDYLLKNGSDPDSLVDSVTALQQACIMKRYDYVKCLLENAATVNNCGHEGKAPLMSASGNDNLEIATLLLSHNAKIDQKDDNGWTALSYASRDGNLNLVKFLHQEGADLLSETNHGSTTLILSVKYIDVMKYLVENGSNVNHKDKNGCTALWLLCNCSYDDQDGALYLIENGADVNAATEDNLTPLPIAASHGNLELVKLLLLFNADITIRGKSDGCTALVHAAFANRFDVLKYFAEVLMDVQTTSNDYGIKDEDDLQTQWQVCFVCAASNNNLKMLTFLREKGLAKINGRDEETLQSVLHYACLQGSYDSALYLIEHGAEINTLSSQGCVPLYFCAIGRHLNLMKLLMEHKAEIDISNYHGNTALFAAAARGFLEIVEFLHENGAKIHVVDEDGDTPLHDAAATGHLSVVQYLVWKNADVAYKNKNGKTPLDLAADNKKAEVVEFLLHHQL